jgi:hypothetical protein
MSISLVKNALITTATVLAVIYAIRMTTPGQAIVTKALVG